MPSKKTMEALRRALGWTQQQLAKKAGCGVATIVRAEAKGGWPGNRSVRKAVQTALGVQS